MPLMGVVSGNIPKNEGFTWQDPRGGDEVLHLKPEVLFASPRAQAMRAEGKSDEEIIWQMFLGWKPELFADNPKQNKSFAAAVFAIQKFMKRQIKEYMIEIFLHKFYNHI
jgi:hypothetical protein